jgi:thiosulfate/3-mercaptopyruvate sulfurtransferase
MMESSKTPSDANSDAAWIASHINDTSVRIVELDVSPAAYNAGHIPGAVMWNAYTDLRHPDYRPVSASELQEILRRCGVASDSTVLFYGYGAHLGFWLLKSHGHNSVRLMDGSREQWKTTCQGWSTELPIPTRSQYALPSQRASFATMEDVQGMLGRPNHIVVDTRSKAEYDGERFWPSGATEGAGRAGHIPGAIHMPVELLRTDDGSFRSADKMLQVVRDRGVTSETEVVTYCTIGNRASQAWFALRHLLGYRNVRVYYGSWAEWGKQADTPIET